MQTKCCSTCKETKPVSEFYKARCNKDGLTYECKMCSKKKGRKYYENNREKIAERQRRYREANKEKIAEYQRRWNRDNKNLRQEYSRKWFSENKKAAQRRASRRAQECNNRSLEIAYRHGLPWEDWEDDFVMADNGLTDYQKAVKLGRSYKSVNSRPADLKRRLKTS